MRDLISIQTALDAILSIIAHADEIYNAVLNLPSVQPERKKGHWIDREHCQVDEDGYDIGICSVCGEEITIDPLHDNFCPNCGADLKTKETDYDYERAVEQLEHDILYEPTFNQDDGSM